jgi:hypothetical protein
MNDLNGEGRSSLWPDRKLDCEKPFTAQVNVNGYPTPNVASGDTIHYSEVNGENHSFLRRGLSTPDPSNYVAVYLFLFLFIAVCCKIRYVVEEGYTVSSVRNSIFIFRRLTLLEFISMVFPNLRRW